MTAVPLHASGGDPTAALRRDLGDLLAEQRLGDVARQLVRDTPEVALTAAALLGFVLGDGVPPALLRLAAGTVGRMAVANLVQRQLFTPRRTA